MLFEMLVGYPPFYAEDALKTCRKILNWQETLQIPPEAKLTWAARDLIQRLICDAKHRLGAENGIEDFKAHPFFKGIDWDNLHRMTPPFIPELKGPTDTRYFEDHMPMQPCIASEHATRKSYLKEPGLEEFIGFTFKRYNANEAPPGRRGALTNALFQDPKEVQQE